jgi:hypothetical protein
MKILINSPLPIALAHGGMQNQIKQTLAAPQSIGLEVEPPLAPPFMISFCLSHRLSPCNLFV